MIKKPAYILYAEDDEEDRFIFLEAVRSVDESINIINVSNGQEAVDCLAKNSAGQELPLAIVSDLRMPRCDGIDLLRRVKQEPRWKHIPVVLFSTSSSRADIALANSLHAEAFYTKPGTYQEFVDMVKAILARCRQHSCAK